LTYTLANAGFNVTNTTANSAGISDLLEQHAEALCIRQTAKAVGITHMLATGYTASDSHFTM